MRRNRLSGILLPHLNRLLPVFPVARAPKKRSRANTRRWIKTKVGPIRTTFKVGIETREERPPEFAAYTTSGEEGSRASMIKAVSTLSLKQLDEDKTEVTYTSEIKLLGRLGKFGSGLMQKVADSIGNEFIATMQDRIKSGE